MKYNATKLLSSSEESFLPRIAPTKSQTDELKEYRKTVRQALRHTFSVLNKAFEKDGSDKWQLAYHAQNLSFSEELRKLSPEQKLALAGITPKFMSQGSFVYKTLNLPCHRPPQQIDLDDGIYLPIEIFRDSPIVSKDLFFSIVDSTLKELAQRKGWVFKEKNTCARLIVSDLVHIDVPLYAIPLERHLIMESLKANATDSVWFKDSRSLLQKDDIYLAVRNRESWINSDPATISEWFKDSVRTHGEILRNVCRHLKAWRDYQFSKGGPSSIALMACAVNTFNDAVHARRKKFHPAQESEALLICAQKLAEQLSEGVLNPTDSTKAPLYPSPDMDKSIIERDISVASEFAAQIAYSLKHAQSKEQSLEHIKKAFGSRVPNRADLIDLADITAAAIMSKPAKTTPAPVVPNGDAG